MTSGGRRRRFSWVAGALALLVLWRTAAVVRYGPLERTRPPAPAAGVHDVRGILHVHTHHSHDGRAGLPEIVAAARSAQVEFVVLTEHNNFGIAPLGQEGWRDGVLLIGGAEIGTCDRTAPGAAVCTGGHLLVVGPTALPGEPTRMPAEELAALARRLGGLAIAAHPTNRRVPWLATDGGLTGVEIVSCFTGYQANHWGSIGLAALLYPFNPTLAMNSLVDEPDRELEFFDRIAAKRRIAGVAGADAHACIRLGRGWNVPLPSMSSFFRFMSTHVLLDKPLAREPVADRAAILAALASGRAYVAWDWIGDPAGFSFQAAGASESAGGPTYAMGSVASRLPVRLRAEAPEMPGLGLKLLRDGETVAAVEGAVLEYTAARDGAYRVEATLDLRSPFFSLPKRQPWILSNPIFVGPRYAPATN